MKDEIKARLEEEIERLNNIRIEKSKKGEISFTLNRNLLELNSKLEQHLETQSATIKKVIEIIDKDIKYFSTPKNIVSDAMIEYLITLKADIKEKQ